MDPIQALWPITAVLHVFGLSVPSSCKFNNYLTKFYFLLFIGLRCGIFAYTLWRNQLFLRSNESVIMMVIDIFSICNVRLLEIIILIEAFSRVRQEKQLMDDFLEIDEIFSSQLNADLKYNQLRRSVLKRFTIWMCTFIFVSGCAVLFAYHTPNFMYFLTYMPPYFTASLTYFQIIMWIDLIRYRLHALNRLLYELNTNQTSTIEIKRKRSDAISIYSKGTPSPKPPPPPPLICATIIDIFGQNNECYTSTAAYKCEQFTIFCDLYRRLWAQTQRINERFKCTMVLNIGNDFISFVLNLYLVFVCILELKTHAHVLVSDFFRLPLSIFHIWMLSRACDKTVQESLKIGYELHNIKNVAENSKLSSNVSHLEIGISLIFDEKKKQIHLLFSDSTFFTSIDPSKSIFQCIRIL